MLRKVSFMLLAALLCLSLTACGGKDDDTAGGSALDRLNGVVPSQTADGAGDQQSGSDTPYMTDMPGTAQDTAQPSSLDFSLDASAPAFSNVDLSNTQGDADPVPEALYIERDGFSYALDPDTLQVIDTPLDPVTHEPVEEIEPEPEPEPSAIEPTEENKYPNTGIFLEDD